ncbi:hypothetical protein ACQPZF_27220 [Actinosynnema sp. CS-041913]|uniref:hypothetical protein n=1 Tax=Actinosynnema sp. CS-041913 TaxID=3239917 RepID=UPI003D8ABE14
MELLWGPGIVGQARAWTEAYHPVDEVDTLDRHFVIRRHVDHDPPRSTAVTAGLPTSRRISVWFLVKADDPLGAFNTSATKPTGTAAVWAEAPSGLSCPHRDPR